MPKGNKLILNKKFNVLDKGFIRVVDYMGDDSSIVQAARISYGKGTKTVSSDRTLIRYLMRNRHTSPFEMCEIKFHIKCPMDVWRQWIRHRTANVNEYSTRYSEAIDDKMKTNPSEWRLQSLENKQGSKGFIDPTLGIILSNEEETFHSMAAEIYKRRLEAGVAREQARKDLPLSTYTEAYWKIDLHNLLHFSHLRLNAQKEIAEYAKVIGDIINEWCPITWEAFLDYRFNSLTLSVVEIDIIRHLMYGNVKDCMCLAKEAGFVTDDLLQMNKNSRECREFNSKLKRLGVHFPWNK